MPKIAMHGSPWRAENGNAALVEANPQLLLEVGAVQLCQTHIPQGWPKSWTKFRLLIGSLIQRAGPNRAVWANPVELAFQHRPVHPGSRKGLGGKEGSLQAEEMALWNLLMHDLFQI